MEAGFPPRRTLLSFGDFAQIKCETKGKNSRRAIGLFGSKKSNEEQPMTVAKKRTTFFRRLPQRWTVTLFAS